MEGQWEVFVDKANQAGVDVIPFELWKNLFVKSTAVAAFEITEFHDGEWCVGVTQARLPFQQQRACERRLGSLVRLAGLSKVLLLKLLDAHRAGSSKGKASQKPDQTAMRDLHNAVADMIDPPMLMAFHRGCRLNGIN